ncbi:hypothetical protein [Caldibacillus thermoamylovorans]|uniref:hypothetical protein n=1 Tax=Caldibacillus thermoamylovorans TaxID=35841 RepID=UPI0012602ED2|nr:hypothetical protein [Caldibacillus thermoamylovorans]
MLCFGDETESRHHFGVKNALFWRRDRISSPFLGEKLNFLAARPVLVTILRWEMLYFGDEPYSRRHFEVKKAQF